MLGLAPVCSLHMFELTYYLQIYPSSTNAGLNFYGLYLRRNFDGSESESITQLVANVPAGEGREISLEPNTNMQIKVLKLIQLRIDTTEKLYND